MTVRMAGSDAESPIIRYPSGRPTVGTSKGIALIHITEISSPGSTVFAHADAGPAGSCNTKSTENCPFSGSASTKV